MGRNRKTIFCDIDGTLIKHKETLHRMIYDDPIVLPGVIDKITEWRDKDYYIILTTARPHGCKQTTEDQLRYMGIFYDRLIMGLPTGPRVVINDKKPDGMVTAFAVSLERDTGLGDINDI